VGYLYPEAAHMKAKERKARHKPKIARKENLRRYILEKLSQKWSPESIAGRWNLENDTVSTSTEAIYQYVYSKEGRDLGLHKLLPRAKRKRGLRRVRSKGPVADRVSIAKRPENINNRSEYGHWEADLVFNKGSQSKNILTAVERKSRYAILIKNESKHSKVVMKAFKKRVKGLAKSVTFDNGSEFAQHTIIRKKHGIETYFCNPGSPWQKGSIENLNGVARRWIPFKVSHK